MEYKMDYSGEMTEQQIIEGGTYPRSIIRYVEAPRRGFVIPSILKTSAVFFLGGGALLGLEMSAPVALRPSTFTGTYEYRVEEQVKAAEMRVQGRYEAWAAQVKAAAEQNVEQYRARTNGMLAAYQASNDRAKTYAEALTRIQGQYVAERMNQTRQTQGTDIAIINFGRLWGRAANLFQPGLGDSALEYSDGLNRQLSKELTDAATQGQTITVDGWNTGLPSASELQHLLDTVKPLTIPPLPPLGPEN
jgi:hypothetical protein